MPPASLLSVMVGLVWLRYASGGEVMGKRDAEQDIGAAASQHEGGRQRRR